MPDLDVAIVGYGPVGQMLAILLGQRGHRVHVVERWPEAYPLPRAVHFDHEVGRILQSAGVAGPLEGRTVPATVYEWRNARGETLIRFGRDAERSLSGWPESSMFCQPELEGILDARARELPNVSVERGCEVVGLRLEPDGVALETTRGGAPRTLRARFAVGCDGANSLVRGQIGSGWHDLGFHFDWLVVDVRPSDPRWDGPINWQLCDPARPTTLVSGGPGRRRWEFMRLPHETLDDLNSEEAAWRLLGPWGVHRGNAKLERHAVYTFRARWADRWRNGRALLAGDAAHQMPPFLGQGMCSGLRDAANLAWKLAAVAHGDAPDTLLDTYQAEREPHVRAIVEAAVGFGRIICTTDPEVAAARDEAMLARRAGAGPDDGTSAETSSSPPLAPGPLVLDGGGVQSVQPVVDGQRLDDYVGPRWLVVGRDRVDGGVAEWWRSAGALVLLVDSHPELAALLGDDDVVVVRPDRYVLGRGSRLEDLTDPVRSLVGAG